MVIFNSYVKLPEGMDSVSTKNEELIFHWGEMMMHHGIFGFFGGCRESHVNVTTSIVMGTPAPW
jgi:hypothetical protein